MRFYPKVHISWPITSAAEGAAYRKHFIMIGAGSGIAPYLSFLEDQLGTLDGLSSGDRTPYFSNYTHAHLVFIVWSDEQIAWISNTINMLMKEQQPALNKITFHIYLTAKRKLKSFHSFLFWRALILMGVKNHEAVKAGEKDFKDPFTDSPIRIFFGRPDFDSLFIKIVDKHKANQYVYTCAPKKLND